MVAWLMLVSAVLGETPVPNSSAAAKPREVAAIRRDVSELLRKENAAAGEEERGRLVQQMSAVYLEIVRDDRFVTNPVLQSQKGKLYTRLLRIRDELKRELRNERRESQEDPQQVALANSLAAHLQLASQTLGGPAAVFEGASGGGPVVDGAELIDLITSTVSPDHWNVNGGPGAIVFYRPALALVVRATGEVQGRVGDLVGGLREAGK